jgi:nitrogen fixation NifU-like protein
MKPHNVGKLENPDASATEGSPACGDQVSIDMQVNPKTMVIEDIKFQSYGCASNIATGSIITDMAKGLTIEEAKNITWKEAAEELDGLPPVKMHCSVLAVDTLRKAILNFEIKNGMAEKEKFSKKLLVEELKKVLYPEVGEDLVTLKMVKYVGFENGVAIVDVDIPKFDKYRDNVAEEIVEHLEQFEEVKEVKVTM